MGYAAAEFLAEKARPVELRLQTTNANKIWLNGELLSQNKVYHAGSKMDQYIGRGKLKPGRNIILLKICQNEQNESWAQDWDFQCRVCDAVGTAVLSADRATSTRANKRTERRSSRTDRFRLREHHRAAQFSSRASRVRKFCNICLPVGVPIDSGWNCRP